MRRRTLIPCRGAWVQVVKNEKKTERNTISASSFYSSARFQQKEHHRPSLCLRFLRMVDSVVSVGMKTSAGGENYILSISHLHCKRARSPDRGDGASRTTANHFIQPSSQRMKEVNQSVEHTLPLICWMALKVMQKKLCCPANTAMDLPGSLHR